MAKAAASGNARHKAPGKGSVPIGLLVVGLAVMLGAFSRGELQHDAAFDGISFELAGPASAGPAHDGYSAARKSNHAYVLVHAEAGRFYALYGPDATQLSGVLVGDGEQRDGVFSSANLHEFSVESGGLRVAAQEGRFAPARFVEHTAAAPAVRPADLASRYEGQLSDATGSWPATLTIGADGELSIDSDTCHARGSAAADGAAAPVRAVKATFEAGCAHHGATLQGHALRHGDTLVLVLPSSDLTRGAVFSGTPTAAP